ncbi:diguanylate cyclase domain-containing protein [Rhodanobacter ginsengiterrae]|uniref:GGDEF domain-containing protein n=1 Tax=Rhodanobacter ginsengiterrae TaxID=2008451 RepID=UPI003CF6EC89
MPLTLSRERFIQSASMITLSLTSFAAGAAALIAWFSPVHRPLDLVIPPVVCVVFLGLLIMLIRWPQRVGSIMRTALLTGLAALVAPAWFYPWQAVLTPGLQLVDTYPPVAALLLVLMVMAMIYLPTRQGVTVVLLGWLLVALPVLAYLFTHPGEMRTPRGADLLMTYGPVFVLFVVLIPVQRGLNSKIRRLVSEQARMEAMANRDVLTGIYNRRFGELVLQDLLARRIPAGVIMFDMDRFKAINDTHGHPAGDRVLQQVAQGCQHLLRKNECLARWGGEEFLVAVPEVDRASLQALAERLRKSIAELSVEQGPQTSASVGVTLIQDGDEMSDLLQRVDQALYRAKQLGGNVVAW